MATEPTIKFASPVAQGSSDRHIIHKTSASSGSGRLSQEVGFPLITSLPPQRGGVAPDRLDFNGIMYMLSAAIYFMQQGGVYLWADEIKEYDDSGTTQTVVGHNLYDVGAVVLDEGKIYFCKQKNGYDVSGVGVQKPSLDTSHTYWEKFITGNIKHTFTSFAISTDDWVEDINTTYGTNYKASITASCNVNDQIHTYFSAESYLSSQDCVILPSVAGQNTIEFYAVNKPSVDITGNYEILIAEGE